jgi:5'-nucleotidase
MNVLLTNDDGIDAPGIAALEEACRGWACRMVVVAPKEPHSGCGHRVTTDRPLVLEEVGPDRYHVDGTPADCVRLALATLFADGSGPDWVLSGINAGGNLGVDIHLSGTVAAAREAAQHGVPALAVSHYHRREAPIDWQRATGWMRAVLAGVVPRPLGPGEFWNVNFPHPPDDAALAVPEFVDCAIDPSPLPLGYESAGGGWHYQSRYSERARVPGGDVAACFGGKVAVSRGRVV